MITLKIDTEDDRSQFEPGEVLNGNVAWSCDQTPQFLELRLFWFTRGKGTEDVGVVQCVKFEKPLQQESRPFQFKLPDSPYSFSGTLISLIWAVDLLALPTEDVVRREFEMGPGKREVKLETVTDSGAARRWLSIKTR